MNNQAHHIVHLDGITKAYQEASQKHLILNQLSLKINVGEKVAVVGRSGSGKTTLLNILSGLITPDQGQYFVLGKEISHYSAKIRAQFRRQNIGYIFQYYNLIPSLTALENIEFVLMLNNKQDRLNYVIEYCKKLEVMDCLDKLPSNLSGGQQQRIAIIRALACSPPIILADEPTGNLDQETGNLVAQCLYEAVESFGASLVLVTHALDLARLSDTQYELSSGQLVKASL